MAPTHPSHIDVPIPHSAHKLDSSRPIHPRKRPPEEISYSSDGESEGTPTPKRRRRYSRSGFSSDRSSPNFQATRASVQVARESSVEDSENESDDVYDEFDLGDFTKEEIRRYEGMVGPGERLRDAASPEEVSGPAAETTADTYEDLLGTTFAKELPEELHGMLRVGLSNAVYRVIHENLLLPLEPFFDEYGDNDDAIDGIADIFMKELEKPAPRMGRFIRSNQLRKTICEHSEPDRLDMLHYNYGPHISVQFAQRIFEQEVYDFARSLGLSKEQATRHVIKAREDAGKCDADLMELGDYDSSECQNILNYLHAHSEQLLAESNTKEAKQVERYLQTLKDNGSHSEYHQIMFSLKFDGSEHSVYRSLRGEIANMEAADQTKKEKAAGKESGKESRKARKAELRAQKEAWRQVEEKKSQKSKDPQAGVMPKEQKASASNSERPAQVQPIEDQEKPFKRRKKGRKLKSELELLKKLEEPSKEYIKHKKGRVAGDVQDPVSKKAKRKRDVGPQHSPFFQRSSNPKAKKDAVKKAEPLMDFQSPVIQSPPTDPPSTPVLNRAPITVTAPPSDKSSPLSSLRSTPSLPSFGGRESKSENDRIIALSYNCPCPNPASSTPKLRNDPNGLPTPASSPISLRDLNKRLLERTIYQDGIVLAKTEALATLSVPKKPRKRSVTVSPFFTRSPCKKPKASDKVSCIPFPPLQSTSFGLVQERLSHDPFRLLIAVIFLNKTRGSVALPVFYELMERYPTPADLAAASQEDVVKVIHHLGLQNQRAKKCINLAKAWLERPPEKGKRYRVLHYPKRDDGKDVRPDEVLGEEDERVAWEIGQLPGIGVYAIDSWRIFCRDELRGLPTGLPKDLTSNAKEEELQKEWTKVVAGDKELRAYLRWRWLRNGWDWDPVTGERRKADEQELAKADRGGVIYEGDCGDMVVGGIKGDRPDVVKDEIEVDEKGGEKEAGEVENIIAETQAPDVLEKGREEADEATTTTPHQNDGVGEEKDASKATTYEPEKGR